VVGITNSTSTDNPIYTSATVLLRGAYIVCSGNIQGKFAKQLDIMMDDGITNTGSMQTQENNSGSPWTAGTIGKAATAAPVDDQLYNVCMGV